MTQPILIYETGGKQVQFNLNPDSGDLWLTQAQLADIFNISPQSINRHIRAIYQEGELDPADTSRSIAQSQAEGQRQITRTVKTYHLNMVIALSFRINSRRASNFRIWLTNILSQYIRQGFLLNEHRLSELSASELRTTIQPLERLQKILASAEFDESSDPTSALIRQYAFTLQTLREYDEGYIRFHSTTKRFRQPLDAGECMDMIAQLRTQLQASDLFGTPRGDNFDGTLRAIFQSFDGHDVYPTLSEKAANLLYLIIKDHPFLDGNKRIACLLFLVFLNTNNYQFLSNGQPKISDRTLTALALMIAESNPREKGLIISAICKMLDD